MTTIYAEFSAYARNVVLACPKDRCRGKRCGARHARRSHVRTRTLLRRRTPTRCATALHVRSGSAPAARTAPLQTWRMWDSKLLYPPQEKRENYRYKFSFVPSLAIYRHSCVHIITYLLLRAFFISRLRASRVLSTITDVCN